MSKEFFGGVKAYFNAVRDTLLGLKPQAVDLSEALAAYEANDRRAMTESLRALVKQVKKHPEVLEPSLVLADKLAEQGKGSLSVIDIFFSEKAWQWEAKHPQAGVFALWQKAFDTALVTLPKEEGKEVDDIADISKNQIDVSYGDMPAKYRLAYADFLVKLSKAMEGNYPARAARYAQAAFSKVTLKDSAEDAAVKMAAFEQFIGVVERVDFVWPQYRIITNGERSAAYNRHHYNGLVAVALESPIDSETEARALALMNKDMKEFVADGFVHSAIAVVKLPKDDPRAAAALYELRNIGRDSVEDIYDVFVPLIVTADYNPAGFGAAVRSVWSGMLSRMNNDEKFGEVIDFFHKSMWGAEVEDKEDDTFVSALKPLVDKVLPDLLKDVSAKNPQLGLRLMCEAIYRMPVYNDNKLKSDIVNLALENLEGQPLLENYKENADSALYLCEVLRLEKELDPRAAQQLAIRVPLFMKSEEFSIESATKLYERIGITVPRLEQAHAQVLAAAWRDIMKRDMDVKTDAVCGNVISAAVRYAEILSPYGGRAAFSEGDINLRRSLGEEAMKLWPDCADALGRHGTSVDSYHFVERLSEAGALPKEDRKRMKAYMDRAGLGAAEDRPKSDDGTSGQKPVRQAVSPKAFMLRVGRGADRPEIK